MSKLNPRMHEEKQSYRSAAVDLQKMPLKSIEDYKAYNQEARRAGVPVKIPPNSLHKQFKIKFERFDQPENVLKFIVVNADVDYEGELIPGKIYILPEPVVRHLDSRAVPIYSEVEVRDGGETRTETRQTGERSRFVCRFLEEVA